MTKSMLAPTNLVSVVPLELTFAIRLELERSLESLERQYLTDQIRAAIASAVDGVIARAGRPVDGVTSISPIIDYGISR